MVRCIGELLALQPRDMYWNAIGMVNNWCVINLDFHTVELAEIRWVPRVGPLTGRWRASLRAIYKQVSLFGLSRQDKSYPGTSGGKTSWIQRLKDEGLDPAKPKFPTDPTTLLNSMVEISKRAETVMKQGLIVRLVWAGVESSEANEQTWFVMCGGVQFSDDLSLGMPRRLLLRYATAATFSKITQAEESIILVAGEDATENFMVIRSSDTRKKLADLTSVPLSVPRAGRKAKMRKPPGSSSVRRSG